ncbi:MAG TPA: aminopeptidase, partial [Candidatus Latescibacteria bacterium]|nr:aminopeptidase [Candidatus Latescibacterota bacterium]
MPDPRFDQLAQVLIGYSTALKEGENVLIEAAEAPDELVISVMRAARNVGARVFVNLFHPRVQREFVRLCSDEQMTLHGEIEKARMEKMQAYISIRGTSNISEMSDVPREAMRIYERRFLQPVHFDVRVKQTKWVALRYPTPSMAQLAQMSTEAFEDFYFQVCTLDYGRMAAAMVPLRELMEKTKLVRIVGPDTDLRFSIEGIPVIACTGQNNIPDGEIFTAPVRDSVNGKIAFNARSPYHGINFESIRLEFDRGKVVRASANNTQKLNEILDADEGSRYVGEFAIGVNPFIRRAMGDIL